MVATVDEGKKSAVQQTKDRSSDELLVTVRS